MCDQIKRVTYLKWARFCVYTHLLRKESKTKGSLNREGGRLISHFDTDFVFPNFTAMQLFDGNFSILLLRHIYETEAF